MNEPETYVIDPEYDGPPCSACSQDSPDRQPMAWFLGFCGGDRRLYADCSCACHMMGASVKPWLVRLDMIVETRVIPVYPPEDNPGPCWP